MPLNWDKFVEERDVWVAHNFPDPSGKRTPLDSVLGVVEECGELAHHHLKQIQSIRGTDEHHIAEAKDAVGDLTVYLLGVMSHHNTRPRGKIDPVTGQDDALLKLVEAVGALAGDQHASYDAWIQTTVSDVAHYAEAYCVTRGWDYEEIVQNTWDTVKQRDWIKYPGTGLAHSG